MHFAAFENERAGELVERGRAPFEVLAVDDDLAVVVRRTAAFRAAAAHGATKEKLSGGVCELRQQKRGKLGEIADGGVHLEIEWKLPPLRAGLRHGERAVEGKLVGALLELALRDDQPLVHDGETKHEGVPLARFPLHTIGFQPHARVAECDVARAAVKNECAFADDSASCIADAEECRECAEVDVGKFAIHAEAEFLIAWNRFRLNVEPAAKRIDLCIPRELTLGQICEGNGERIHLQLRRENHARSGHARAFEIRPPAHFPEDFVEPLVLHRDLSGDEVSGLNRAHAEPQILGAGEFSAALNHYIGVAHMEHQRRASLPAGEPLAQPIAGGSAGNAVVAGELQFCRNSVELQFLPPDAVASLRLRAEPCSTRANPPGNGCGEKITPRKPAARAADFQPRGRSGRRGVAPHRIAHHNGLKDGSLDGTDPGVNAVAPAFHFNIGSHDKGKNGGLNRDADEQDQPENQQSEFAEEAAFFATFFE